MPTASRRPWLTATTLGVALVALIVALLVAFLAFTTEEGARSPEGAVSDLFDAIKAGDALGVLESLPPGERRALHDSTVDLETQLSRLGLLTTFDTHRVPGAHITVDGLAFHREDLSTLAAAIDIVGGAFVVTTDPQAYPFSDHVDALLKRDFEVDVSRDARTITRDFAQHPLRLVALREGGGWHVSAAYTIAEAIRADHHAPLPEFGKGPDAVGSNLPEEAVVDMVNGFADADPQRVLTVMYPDEVRALYDYAPVFLPDAKQRATAADQDGSYQVQVNRVETSMTGEGSSRRVRITKLDVDIRDHVHKAHVTYDGHCYQIDYRFGGDDPFSMYRTCEGDAPSTSAARNRPLDDPFSPLAVFGKGAEFPTFVVVERNGRWFVSPTQTLVGSLVDTLTAASPGDVDALTDRFAPTVRAAIDDVRGVNESTSGTAGTTAGTTPETTTDTTAVEQSDPAQQALDECGNAVDRHDSASRKGDKARREALITRCLEVLANQ